MSSQIETLLGYTPAEWIEGNMWLEALHPDDAERVRGLERPGSSGDGRAVERCEYRLYSKSGEVVWVCDDAYLERRKGARPFLRGVLTDITPLKRAEEERERSLSLLQAALDSTADGLLVVDPEGKITSYNRRFTEMWKVPQDLIEGRDDERALAYVMDQLVEPDMFLVKVRELYATPTASSFDVLVFKDGRVFERYSLPQVLGDEVVGRVWSFRDVTDRARAVDELQKSEADLRDAQRLAQVGSWSWDAKTGSSSWSDEQYVIFGLEPGDADVSFESFLERVHPEDRERVERESERAVAEGVSGYLDFRIFTPEGDVRHLHTFGQVELSEDGAPAAMRGFAQDVTDRLELERQLRESHKMEAVARLAGGVAHDFNNLLQVILGHCHLLLERSDLPSEARSDLEQVRQAAQMAAGISTQLLDVSRRRVVHPSTLDLNEVLAETKGILRSLVGERVELDVSFAPAPLLVRADRGLLEQVLVNLVTNARDAMPEGGEVAVTADSGALPPSGKVAASEPAYARLVIEDTGSGIAADNLERVFEPFFSTKQRERGSGLGLATAHGIVQRHHGHIVAKNRSGGGARFEVYLPLVGPGGEGGAGAPVRSRSAPVVLVVEDESAVRELAARVLRKDGYSILTAGSGEEAIAVIESYDEDIDVLLTDVVMPGMNGRQLAARVAELKPRTRTIFMSGYTEDALEDGPVPAAAFLPKPFDISLLRARVREVMGRGEDAPPGGRARP